MRRQARDVIALVYLQSAAVFGLLAALAADVGFMGWALTEWSPDYRTVSFILLPSLVAIAFGSAAYPRPLGKAALVLGAPFVVSFICIGLPAFVMFYFFSPFGD